MRYIAPLLALALAAPVAAQDIGVVAAVNRDVTGTRPTETERQLFIREKLVLDERVRTSDIGGGQVMFLDQTTLTLSPNSDLVLDRYVFDPEAQTGDVAISLVRGAMRFVGGRITKTGVATIKTPSATIGIRGGIGHVRIGDDGGTQYVHIAGTSSTITNVNGTVVVTREGGVVSVPPAEQGGGTEQDSGLPSDDGTTGRSGDGGSGDPFQQTENPQGGEPEYLGVATPEQLEIALGDEGGRGTGGIEIPLEPQATNAGVEQLEIEISSADNATQAPPISTQGEQQETSFNETPPEFGEPPQDDIADENIAEEVAEELPQILDGIVFNGTWEAVAGLANGDFVVPDGPLTFEMQYSLLANEGIILIELPETGDLAAANVTTLDGVSVKGDRFIVIGDEDLTITAEDRATLLGGDAADSLLVISTDDVASGAIFVDYTGSSLANTDFVDGEINPVRGDRVVGDEVSNRTTQLREVFDQ